jgi:hypothetical protein
VARDMCQSLGINLEAFFRLMPAYLLLLLDLKTRFNYGEAVQRKISKALALVLQNPLLSSGMNTTAQALRAALNRG